MAAASVNATCDERYGWFASSIEDECRKILSKYMAEAFSRKIISSIKTLTDCSLNPQLSFRTAT